MHTFIRMLFADPVGKTIQFCRVDLRAGRQDMQPDQFVNQVDIVIFAESGERLLTKFDVARRVLLVQLQ